MLYVIYGTDRVKGRARFRAVRDRENKNGSDEYVVEEGVATSGFLDTVTASRGLFGETTLFVFDGVFEKKEEQEILLAHGQALAESINSFLIFEPTLEKEIAVGLEALAAENFEYALPKVDTRPEFNIFSLGDALGRRDKKELWILYQRAIGAGLASEEICNTLFWTVKNLALMKSTPSGDDAGLNPFVARKSRGFAVNYTADEITGLSHSLSTIYHEAHRGGEPMDIALERFVLSLYNTSVPANTISN